MNVDIFRAVPERKSLGQFVYEELKGAIINGQLAPGERVAESRIAQAMKISRTPVREAFHKLEREGWIRHLPNSGFFVAGLSRQDVEETFGIRSALESYAARLAAIRHTPDDLVPLQKKIEEYQEHMEKGDIQSLFRINTEFHDLLYALSQSPKLIKMINDVRDQIYRYRRVILRVKGMARRSNEDHKLMLQFISKRDAEGVEKLVKEHILRGQNVVLKEFDMCHSD
ncbi:MAG: GntR family transcriptional regulator [Deltaproteobacteria bacterium]|nr:GntR family transcriptional regulator [Deltaproteobacteria bacterium]MBW1928150.1 GntR family transcriptional regulator [Deltaproteobacteria bacterium]MBW2025655.1 GntR family transcriptional regulator [Deltaproteobacteria bacterium]MBW2125631.1 GntR family transcriptional regulator [Deltaproteobacteria bacterium]RLB18989.1 MAG: GntR family transcriptional regulator [Deltaproteobacteria bacterium]